jgi:hypothetical protein
MSQQAAKRRRRQALMGFTHMAPQVRPHYKKPDAMTSKARLQRAIATERRIAQKKG